MDYGTDAGNSGNGGKDLFRGLFNPQPLRSLASGAYPQLPPEPDPIPAPYLQYLGAVPPDMIGPPGQMGVDPSMMGAPPPGMIGPPGQMPVGGLGPASQPNQMFEAQGVPDLQGLPPELLMQLMSAYGVL